MASLASESTLAATSARPASCEAAHVAALAVATNQVAAFIAALALLPGLVAMSTRLAMCELALVAALAVTTIQIAAVMTAHTARLAVRLRRGQD